MKTCKNCGKEKTHDDFDYLGCGSYRDYCKECYEPIKKEIAELRELAEKEKDKFRVKMDKIEEKFDKQIEKVLKKMQK